MYKCKYPHLFQPLRVGNLTLRNRIIASPTGYFYTDSQDLFTDEMIAFYEQKAKGGAAVVTVSEGYVDRRGIDIFGGVCLDSDLCLENICRLADTISRYGAIPSMELQHSGMYSTASFMAGEQLYAVMETEIQGAANAGAALNGQVLPEMPEEVILDIINKYAEAALRCKRAGFKMVLVHAGHGWLLNQFLAPSNKRTDRWGGSFENRIRFTIEVCKKIKEVCGQDFPIEFRMSGDELSENGYDIKEGVRIAQAIEEYVDYLHVSVGLHENAATFCVTTPSMFLDDGCNMKFAEEIKKHVKKPVCTVGAFSNPEIMEEAIASGKVDLVALGRQMIADPELPNKARAGRSEDINSCLRCMTCYSNLVNKFKYTCAINPTVGNHRELKYAIQPVESRKVLVVGGGIGGMTAALTAVGRGHRVILCEKSDRLGGVLNCEENVPFKKKLAVYISGQAKRIQNNKNIELHLNTEVTPDYARELEADAIICAVGARPVVPTFIPGYDNAHVYGAEEIYHDLEKAGNSVILIGGGLVGCELGIYLAQKGREVTILEMLPELNFGGNFVHGMAIFEQLAKYGIKVSTGTKVLEIKEGGVIAQSEKGTETLTADTIIYSVGQASEKDLVDSLRDCAPEFYSIGDCNTPATIYQANQEAFFAARNIGAR